jgi:hypothetical protein
VKKIALDSKIFLVFHDNGKLSSLGINIEGYSFKTIYPHEIIQFSTICKTFLQGRFDKRKIVFTNEFNRLNTSNGVVELYFTETATLSFEKISENNTVYLSCGVISDIAIAESKNNMGSTHTMIDQEISLKTPKKCIRFSQFICQYYVDVLQKVSYVWI